MNLEGKKPFYMNNNIDLHSRYDRIKRRPYLYSYECKPVSFVYCNHEHTFDIMFMERNGCMARKITVKGNEISILDSNMEEDYICITDMARYKNPERTGFVIQNWMRNRNTIEFLGIWEQLNNVSFKHLEFDAFRMASGLKDLEEK